MAWFSWFEQPSWHTKVWFITAHLISFRCWYLPQITRSVEGFGLSQSSLSSGWTCYSIYVNGLSRDTPRSEIPGSGRNWVRLQFKPEITFAIQSLSSSIESSTFSSVSSKPTSSFLFRSRCQILKLFPASTLVLYNLSSSSLFTINASVLNLQISPTVHLQYHLTRLFNLTNSHIP